MLHAPGFDIICELAQRASMALVCADTVVEGVMKKEGGGGGGETWRCIEKHVKILEAG